MLSKRNSLRIMYFYHYFNKIPKNREKKDWEHPEKVLGWVFFCQSKTFCSNVDSRKVEPTIFTLRHRQIYVKCILILFKTSLDAKWKKKIKPNMKYHHVRQNSKGEGVLEFICPVPLHSYSKLWQDEPTSPLNTSKHLEYRQAKWNKDVTRQFCKAQELNGWWIIADCF